MSFLLRKHIVLTVSRKLISCNSVHFMYLGNLQFKYLQRHSITCHALLIPVGFKEYYRRYLIFHERKDYFLKLTGLHLRKTIVSFSRCCFICSVDLFPVLRNSDTEWDRSACFFSVMSMHFVFASNQYRNKDLEADLLIRKHHLLFTGLMSFYFYNIT